MRRALARLRRWLQPSLGRRLLLAQMAVMLMLWTTLVGALLRRKGTRLIARLVLLALAVVMVLHGWFGSQLAPKNLALKPRVKKAAKKRRAA